MKKNFLISDNVYCSKFDSVQSFPAQFVNFNGGDTGNYSLVTGNLGKNYATDGTDVGGDISTINTAAGKVTGGTWTLP